MTIILICLAIVLIGSLLIFWGYTKSYDGVLVSGAAAAAFFALLGIIINLLIWIPSEKDSEIRYMQYIQEKQTIEEMLNTEDDMDRLLLNQKIIDYNNKIISEKENSKRFIIGDYYSKNVDWEALELITWR